jgi:hypothetical protein
MLTPMDMPQHQTSQLLTQQPTDHIAMTEQIIGTLTHGSVSPTDGITEIIE